MYTIKQILIKLSSFRNPPSLWNDETKMKSWKKIYEHMVKTINVFHLCWYLRCLYDINKKEWYIDIINDLLKWKDDYINNQDFMDKLKIFVKNKKNKSKLAITISINKLLKYNIEEAISMLEDSIENWWQWVFPRKNNNKTNTNTKIQSRDKFKF